MQNVTELFQKERDKKLRIDSQRLPDRLVSAYKLSCSNIFAINKRTDLSKCKHTEKYKEKLRMETTIPDSFAPFIRRVLRDLFLEEKVMPTVTRLTRG